VPVVFVCIDNGWAISVASAAQTASESFAAKGAAYGVPGVQVDGNDALACFQATKTAVERARPRRGALARRPRELPDARALELGRPDEVPRRRGGRALGRARPDRPPRALSPRPPRPGARGARADRGPSAPRRSTPRSTGRRPPPRWRCGRWSRTSTRPCRLT
jgi:hypothetical protein